MTNGAFFLDKFCYFVENNLGNLTFFSNVNSSNFANFTREICNNFYTTKLGKKKKP